jgi:hypothetical protein
VTPRRSSKLSYSLPAGKTGWYYIKVNEYQDDATGKYKVRALQNGGDRDVGGSGKTTALALSDNETTGRYVAGDLTGSDVEDWFKVTLSSQEHVTFHTADGTLDTIIEIYDDGTNGYSLLGGTSNTWMRSDDDGAMANLKSQSHFCAPRPGDYYVKVRPYSTDTGSYTLYVQRMGNSAPAYPSFP